MRSILLVLITGVALSSPAFAAHHGNSRTESSNHRNYDLRDVQPYPGETLPGCPYGAGYSNTQCNGMQAESDADRGAAIHDDWMRHKKNAPQAMSSYDRTTAIQNSHGML